MTTMTKLVGMFTNVARMWSLRDMVLGYKQARYERLAGLHEMGRLACAWNEVALSVRATTCVLAGHDWVAEGADAENGSEDLFCQRCGCSMTVRF